MLGKPPRFSCPFLSYLPGRQTKSGEMFFVLVCLRRQTQNTQVAHDDQFPSPAPRVTSLPHRHETIVAHENTPTVTNDLIAMRRLVTGKVTRAPFLSRPFT